jgi:hypothetical protein
LESDGLISDIDLFKKIGCSDSLVLPVFEVVLAEPERKTAFANA